MASLSDTFEARRAAAAEVEAQVNTRDVLKLEQRVGRVEVATAIIAVTGLLLGLVNFVLILVLLGRL